MSSANPLASTLYRSPGIFNAKRSILFRTSKVRTLSTFGTSTCITFRKSNSHSQPGEVCKLAQITPSWSLLATYSESCVLSTSRRHLVLSEMSFAASAIRSFCYKMRKSAVRDEAVKYWI